ncbi:MAG: hypothetical protein KatS3mg105_1015 [Gemmatales bacterium]|nr:MAG: hypothetical protein KatS3mg105_1015 [Gemmatales bacterium]
MPVLKKLAQSRWLQFIAFMVVIAGIWQAAAQGNKGAKRFASKTITTEIPGHAIDVDVDITGAKTLFLVVTDAGDGNSCDWADWAEPRLIGPAGEKKLTELKWKSADAGWGQVRINKNAAGGAMMIAGKPVPYGIGTHAHSVIVYDLPKGFTRFKAKAGLDNGGTNQADGRSTSVQFHVYVDKLPARLQASRSKTAGGIRDPKEAVNQLDVGDGLEVTLFASEPMLLSPTNIDVDAKGRVWVCECVNYRRRANTRKEGDRILILEDTDGDGVADRRKVYYQGRDVDSAMGICVLGNRVIVSCSPNILVFTDTDGDDKPDKKEFLFTKTGQPQHDHSAHAFLFGPDGRLYWNFGNTGHAVHDKNGKPVISRAGHPVVANGKPYREGMVFRCDPDGSHFEVLGWNFRNNYEVTVDSFGTLWQSDNDDDGNRGVRINYVMEFGNFGYKDEMTGAGWRTPRTGMAQEIPLRHWHLNDPGVVPNLLQTGAGSPCGICVYEGKLLPKRFWNQLIHCDAGPNVVRAYLLEKDGAGYRAEIDNILVGTRDKWFRPSDVCVAPDGSLLIADWYDPGVGGHGMGDIDRGRIFRVAPPKTPYKIPAYDYSTPEGAIKALGNPALSVRYLAWQSLHAMGKKAEAALQRTLEEKNDPRLRARVLWLLGRIKGRENNTVARALEDDDPDIRIVGLRLARQIAITNPQFDLAGCVAKVVGDPSPQVRRDAAIALAEIPKNEKLWAELAMRHDGKDRWYLEALGIGARHNWDACLRAWLDKVDKWNTPAGRDIVWRSRSEQTPKLLAEIILDPRTPTTELPRYFRAFDFQTGPNKEASLKTIVLARQVGDQARQRFIAYEALKRLQSFDANTHRSVIDGILKSMDGTNEYVELVGRFSIADHYPRLLKLAQKHPTSQLAVNAMSVLLAKQQMALLRDELRQKDVKRAMATAQAVGMSKDGRAYDLLMPLVVDESADIELRRQAVQGVAQIKRGAHELLKLASENKLDPRLKDAVAASLHRALWPDVKSKAVALFPLPASKNAQPLPPISQLVKMRGDAERGRKIFMTTGTCNKCHMVNNEGKQVGPDLSEIGSKLSREAMFESVLFPSAAISHNYEGYVVELKNGTVFTGLIVSQDADSVTLKDAESIVRTLKRSDIESLNKMPISFMPADLMKTMSQQDLVDVVSFLTTLKKKQGK